MTETNLTVLPPDETEYTLLNPENMAQMMDVFQQNVGSDGISSLDLPRIKVAAGDTQVFKLQGLQGDETEKQLEGIILAWRKGRLYWKEDPNQPGARIKRPPDCVSKDAVTGEGDPGGECALCPYAKFGSNPKGGRGQACKQIRQLLLVRPGESLPYLIAVPPTSLKPASQYFLMLWSRQVPFWAVTTKLQLDLVRNADGIEYSKIQFSLGRRLSPQEKGVLQPYQEKMSGLLSPMALDAGDYDRVDDDAAEPRSAPRSWREQQERQARQAEGKPKPPF